MSTDVTEPIRMDFTLPIHFYTYLDMKREIRIIIKGYPQPSFAKTKPINAWIIAIFLKKCSRIERDYILETRPDPGK